MESRRKRTLISSSVIFVIAACMGVTMVDAKPAARFSSQSINPDTDQLNLTCAIGNSEKVTTFQIQNRSKYIAAIDVHSGIQDYGTGLKVEGNIRDPMREFFLSVMIPNPGKAYAGKYTCIIYIDGEDTLLLDTTVQWLDEPEGDNTPSTDTRADSPPGTGTVTLTDSPPVNGTGTSNDSPPGSGTDKDIDSSPGNGSDIGSDPLPCNGTNKSTDSPPDVMTILATIMDKVESVETEMDYQKNKHESELKVLRTENMESKLQSFRDEVSSLNAKLTWVIEHQQKQMKMKPPPIIAFDAKKPINFKSSSAYIKFETVTLNKGNGYKQSSGSFQAPTKGIYVFHLTVTTEKIGYLDVKLTGGPGPWQGRLEVEKKGKWGTVCDDHFDWKELKVVCPSLGYSDGRIIRSAPMGPWKSKPVWMDNIGCEPWDTRLKDCPHDSWGHHNCHHGEDITLSCYGTLTRRPHEYGILYLVVDGNWHKNVKVHSWETGSISTVVELNAGVWVKPYFKANEGGVIFNEDGTLFSGHLLTPL